MNVRKTHVCKIYKILIFFYTGLNNTKPILMPNTERAEKGVWFSWNFRVGKR